MEISITKSILIYFIIINIIGFISMGIDKSKSKRNKWRISEKTLFVLALVGGSIGSIIGMKIFRHKTKHWYFKFGMPIILIFQVIGIVYILIKFPK